jgi:lipopolysaccharide transport system permease protein
MLNQFQLALSDFYQSLFRYRYWIFLGVNDVLKQYRRSFLGPIWISLNTGIFVVVFSLVGAQLFNQDVRSYAAYFCTGFVVFGFLTSIVNEGCQCFISAEGYLKQFQIQKMIFPLQVVVRNFVTFSHNLVVVLMVLIWSGSFYDIDYIRFFGVLAIVFLNGVLLAATLGALSARFRDIPLIVATVLQTLFFLTPVMWKPEQLTERAQFIMSLNPLAVFLDAIRSALLGQAWTYDVVVGLLFISVTIVLVWLAVFGVARRRIPYWV